MLFRSGRSDFYAQALEKLGRQYERNLEPEKAIKVYETLLVTQPGEEASFRVLVKLVDLELRRGRVDAAMARIRGKGDSHGGISEKYLANDGSSETQVSLQNLRAMVRRTAFSQLRFSTALLTGAVLGLGLVFIAPALVVLSAPWHQESLSTTAGIISVMLSIHCYGPTLREYGRSAWEGLGLPVAAALYGAMTMASAVAHWRHEGGQWKGRNYGPSAS